MRNFVLFSAILLAVPALRAQTTTFGAILKGEGVQRIVIGVFDEKVKTYNERAALMESPKLSYDEGAVADTSGRAAETRIPGDLSPIAAANKLRAGLGIFVDAVVEYARDQAKNAAVVLNKEIVEKYLDKARSLQRCGEVPCNQPPCCRLCAPPPCPPGDSKRSGLSDPSDEARCFGLSGELMWQSTTTP
ncbi:MAG: hypothetical protein LAO30_26045 [Acidobacteriia bacterium]|nr:hypothetical protein [Terriglobia bacterium]